MAKSVARPGIVRELAEDVRVEMAAFSMEKLFSILSPWATPTKLCAASLLLACSAH